MKRALICLSLFALAVVCMGGDCYRPPEAKDMVWYVNGQPVELPQPR